MLKCLNDVTMSHLSVFMIFWKPFQVFHYRIKIISQIKKIGYNINVFPSQNELNSPIAANSCPTIFRLRFLILCYFFTYWYMSLRYWCLEKVRILKFQSIQPHKEHRWIWMWLTLLWCSILAHTKFLTRLNYLRAFIAYTSTWISCK